MSEEFKPQGEKLGIGLSILSFLIPLAGLIIWIMNKNDHPEKAKSACYLAIAGVVVGIVLQVILGLAG
ncbi:hypothetical protein [Flavobacterium sp.]|uniref:hypothetical protein n=1 Tax=Flavobacterium sp. TaxID=239 RepID=UPI00120C9BF0|nr:hypothetical protein [Flavobacterium sp.]RZJ72979.1 MAG: hypothetical protein EOO49_04950 [Flavobacterium sp.]